jgi:hypothetical protein
MMLASYHVVGFLHPPITFGRITTPLLRNRWPLLCPHLIL